MRPTDWAYLAGRIDADGSIGCYKHSDPNNKWISVRLDLYSNDLEYLESVQEALGGWISKNNTTWQWCAGAKIIEGILVNLVPYLTTKKDQAELALACRRTYDKSDNQHSYFVTESKRLNGRLKHAAR